MKTKPKPIEYVCRHEAQARHEVKGQAALGYIIVLICGILFYGTLFLAIRSVVKDRTEKHSAIIRALADNTADNNASTP